MIYSAPPILSLIFGLTVFLTLVLFIWALRSSQDPATVRKAKPVTIGLIAWLILQGVLSGMNIYNTDATTFPPRILLIGVLPPVITILFLFATQSGRQFIDSLPLLNLTWLHIVRVPVEIVLFWLFLDNAIPKLMTFEGRNFDIIAGLTAPLIAYYGFIKKKLSKISIMLWNFLCIALLMNIVVNAFLSLPSPLQQFAFDQPNIAVLNFPVCWLPVFIVPVVLFGHLAAIRQLSKAKGNSGLLN